MTSAASAIEAAAFSALEAGVSVQVFQHVPAEELTPYVVIGDIDTLPFGGKGNDPDRRATLDVGSFTDGEQRLPVLTITEQIEQTLDGLTVTRDGWTISFTFAGSGTPATDDGSAYDAVTRFNVLALSND